MHQGRPILFPTSGPWASGIILLFSPVFAKSKICFFQEIYPHNPSFSLILELMELENIVANTVYLKVIFRAPTIVAIASNTVHLLLQSFILIASPDYFVQLPNRIPKLIKMDELENILANSIYKQVTHHDTPWHFLSYFGGYCG